MTPRVIVVTGTSTDVGKTVTVAALAAACAAAGLRPAVCKAAQTGVGPTDLGDADEVVRLCGGVAATECARFPDPLAPETAARRAGRAPVTLDAIAAAVHRLATDADLVIVEGAGGVLVRLAPDLTVIDVAARLHADVLVVTDPGLGTLNHTELTVRALRSAGRRVLGLVVGSWPEGPDLAMTSNLDDLPRLSETPILGAIPAGAGARDPRDFRSAAPEWFAPDLIADLAAHRDETPAAAHRPQPFPTDEHSQPTRRSV
ncbi:dethiobiotin synthase [Gordonia shandongensis]|uniref:dethiobiotin synthase n=1 Tax=Gordonia shandongensis TaxID=376351 RepID=UPI00041617D0|nr:dethiobiotin synthase [Gordonia shandongensis]